MTATNPLKIVDVSSLDTKTADKVLDAMTNQGFLFVDGHDFTQKEVDHYFELSKQFFDLPLEEKLKVPMNFYDCGYTTFNQENLDPGHKSVGDPKECFNFGKFNFVTGDFARSQLPDMFQYGTENYEFISKIVLKMYNLGVRILNLLAIGLKIDQDEGGANWFSDRHPPDGETICSMRMLHYPPISKLDAEEKDRCGAHTDYGSVSLLFQQKGQEGLELLDLSENWIPIPHVQSPNEKYRLEGRAAPIVVNIANLLSFWTNGVLKSTMHRVRLPVDGDDRYSIVFFLAPENKTRLIPIPSPIVAAAADGKINTNKKETDYMIVKDYFIRKFKETYLSGHDAL